MCVFVPVQTPMVLDPRERYDLAEGMLSHQSAQLVDLGARVAQAGLQAVAAATWTSMGRIVSRRMHRCGSWRALTCLQRSATCWAGAS